MWQWFNKKLLSLHCYTHLFQTIEENNNIYYNLTVEIKD